MRHLLFIIFEVVKMLTRLFLCVLILASCVDDHGNRVEGGELTVYFDRNEDLQLASAVAAFWKENNLLTGVKQDLKLFHQDSTHYIFLIKRDDAEIASFDIKERKLLLELQSQLQDSLFKKSSLELVISDDHFKPLMNIND